MRSMVEGCPAIERVTPLRQGFALPPPLTGEEYDTAQSAMGVAVSIRNGALRTGTPVSGWPEPTEAR